MGGRSTSYYVCAIRSSDGAITFEALRSSQLDERMKQLKKDFIMAYRSWKLAAKEAEDAGEEFDEPKPTKPGIKRLGKRIKGERKAQATAALFQEKWDEKMRKKQDKELEKLEDDKTAAVTEKG
ncbi:MAG: hypothetical protein ACODAJ_08530 [Planctomycetota bacterium]